MNGMHDLCQSVHVVSTVHGESGGYMLSSSGGRGRERGRVRGGRCFQRVVVGERKKVGEG